MWLANLLEFKNFQYLEDGAGGPRLSLVSLSFPRVSEASENIFGLESWRHASFVFVTEVAGTGIHSCQVGRLRGLGSGLDTFTLSHPNTVLRLRLRFSLSSKPHSSSV